MNKNKLWKNFLFIVGLLIILFMPNMVEADNDSYFSCTYTLKSVKGNKGISGLTEVDGKVITISLNKDKTTVTKQYDKETVGPNLWRYVDKFDDKFKSAILNEKDCPTIGVRYIDMSSTVEISVGGIETVCESAEGTYSNSCENFNASSKQLSDEAKKDDITVTYQTCSFSERVYYYNNRSKFFKPSFRRSSAGKTEWALNESGSSSVWVELKKEDLLNSAIELDDGSGNVRIAEDLYNSIFETSTTELNCPGKFVRNVDHMGGNGTQLTNLVLSLETLKEYQIWTESDDYLSYSSERESKRKNNATLDGLNQSITCSQLFSHQEEGSVVWLIQKLLSYIRLLGPILVVILSSIDFIKAIASSDENAIKKAQSKLVIRLIAAIILFLVPTLVDLLLNIVLGANNSSCVL